MEADQSAGAASDLPGYWREVDWRSVTVEVRRLQVRIVKAVKRVDGAGSKPCNVCSQPRGAASCWPFGE